MQIINLKQGSPEWLDWRYGGIGSSDAMVIAAENGMIETQEWMDDIDDLFNEKMNRESRTQENFLMIRGKKYEGEAREFVENTFGILLQPLCGTMDFDKGIRASFDGVNVTRDRFTEIKVPNDKVHLLAKSGEIVDYYLPQVAHQALVLFDHPSQWPDDRIVQFCSYYPEETDGAVVKKPLVFFREFALELLGHEQRFLENLRTGLPPCGSEYFSLARRYYALDTKIKELTAARDVFKAKMSDITEARGRKKIKGGGVSTIHVEKKGAIDWNKLAAQYNITEDEVEKYRKSGSEYWTTRVDPKFGIDDEHLSRVADMDKATAKTEAEDVSDKFWSSLNMEWSEDGDAPSEPESALSD